MGAKHSAKARSREKQQGVMVEPQCSMLVLEAAASVHPSAVRLVRSLCRGVELDCQCAYCAWPSAKRNEALDRRTPNILVLCPSAKGHFPGAMIEWVREWLGDAGESLGLLVVSRPNRSVSDEFTKVVAGLERAARLAEVDFISA